MAPITNPLLKPALRQMVEERGGGADSFISLLISNIISLLLLITVLIFLFFFVQGGLKIILSEGDKTKVEEGQRSLTYAFLGLVIVFCLFAFLKMLGYFFGIEGLGDLKLTWPSL